ncbi:Leo1-like protein [Penicillium griseofulvum]|uniref:Leo1-like protein n=1 Tax=Penicillium patulum TaxID=5078 RepID=A0A135LRP4_PENPA|nr:Leo1-like protein [Penicillium griseofulvum]KXG51623.1 Leo1-like protein [Penicillium griseofulvum]
MSSDEEGVRRPNGNESPAHSNANDSGADQMDEGDDLFGSDGEGGLDDIEPHRSLDDEHLDSGDDEHRYDRREDRMEDVAQEEHHVNIIDQDLSRAPMPLTNDGEVYTMRVPDFLSIEGEEFNPETYVPPPYQTAATSLCWRKDPADGSLLQSNARIIKWEDGSITLQLASSPLEQYRIASKPLAPLTKSGEYDHKLDSHVYLAAGLETAQVFRLSSHVTQGLTILPTTLETDDAVQRLQEQLAAAARGSKQTAAGTAPRYELTEDPELAARRAEMMEKEAIKAERRRQQLADREADRGRRHGASRAGPSGLSVGGLEDGGLLTTRPRAKPRRQNRRGEIYTDDEEDYSRGARNKEDEYDEDDGFLVGSDEELEEEAEDDEEELEDEDMDAEGEDDVEAAPAKAARSKPESQARASTPPTRKKNRYVVDDEDDE